MSIRKKNLSIEQMNEEVREFLYIITHDLKNTVRGIKQASDWLLADYKEKLGKEGEQLLDILESKSSLLSDMLDDINNYSKVNFKKDSIVKINFNEIVDIVVNSLNQSNKKNEKSIKLLLKKEFDENLLVECDEVKFSQILFNVFSNLLLFSGEDKTEVNCLVSYSKTADEKYFIFTFTCKEIKFDVTRIAKLFAPFQEITINSKKINTKMTLTLAQKISESFGGELNVQAGQGLSFVLEYPIKITT